MIWNLKQQDKTLSSQQLEKEVKLYEVETINNSFQQVHVTMDAFKHWTLCLLTHFSEIRLIMWGSDRNISISSIVILLDEWEIVIDHCRENRGCKEHDENRTYNTTGKMVKCGIKSSWIYSWKLDHLKNSKDEISHAWCHFISNCHSYNYG